MAGVGKIVDGLEEVHLAVAAEVYGTTESARKLDSPNISSLIVDGMQATFFLTVVRVAVVNGSFPVSLHGADLGIRVSFPDFGRAAEGMNASWSLQMKTS